MSKRLNCVVTDDVFEFVNAEAERMTGEGVQRVTLGTVVVGIVQPLIKPNGTAPKPKAKRKRRVATAQE